MMEKDSARRMIARKKRALRGGGRSRSASWFLSGDGQGSAREGFGGEHREERLRGWWVGSTLE